jgi:uncharacterized protein
MRSADQVAAMSCPVCQVPLSMSDRQGIEIDYCPQCRGVWLDRGELDKIIERSAPTSAPVSAPPPASRAAPQAPYPAQGYPQQQGYPPQSYGHQKGYKRHKSWLEDIFD